MSSDDKKEYDDFDDFDDLKILKNLNHTENIDANDPNDVSDSSDSSEVDRDQSKMNEMKTYLIISSPVFGTFCRVPLNHRPTSDAISRL